MAVFAFTDGYVALNTVDHSTDIKSVTLSMSGASLDSTTMGDTWTEQTPGVASGTLSIEWVDDVANSALDDILFALFNTVTTFEIRATSAAVGTSNPKYTGSVHVNGHPIGGSHGDLAMKSVTYPLSGTVTRAEA